MNPQQELHGGMNVDDRKSSLMIFRLMEESRKWLEQQMFESGVEQLTLEVGDDVSMCEGRSEAEEKQKLGEQQGGCSLGLNCCFCAAGSDHRPIGNAIHGGHEDGV